MTIPILIAHLVSIAGGRIYADLRPTYGLSYCLGTLRLSSHSCQCHRTDSHPSRRRDHDMRDVRDQRLRHIIIRAATCRAGPPGGRPAGVYAAFRRRKGCEVTLSRLLLLRTSGWEEVVGDGVEESAADSNRAAEHLDRRHRLAERDGTADDDDRALRRVGD